MYGNIKNKTRTKTQDHTLQRNYKIIIRYGPTIWLQLITNDDVFGINVRRNVF